jgi:cold shock CspA family protein
MPLGRIAKFFEDRGYGFIKPDGGGPDVFFNMKEVTRLSWGIPSREIGQKPDQHSATKGAAQVSEVGRWGTIPAGMGALCRAGAR